MSYRIHHQLVAIPAAPPYIIYSNTTNRGHHLQLQQHHCIIKSYRHSHFPSVVNLWNKLSSGTVWGGCIAQSILQPTRLTHATLNHNKKIWTIFYQHHAMHWVFYHFLIMFYLYMNCIQHISFYAYFTHGPNTSASAQ